MKRLFLATITIAIIGGRLDASSIIDCSGDAAAINSCVSSKMPNFQTQLDWAILGQPFSGTIYSGVWTATNVLPGMDVSVSDVGTGGGEGLRLAYNLGTVFYAGEWTSAGSVPAVGYTHPGHFLGTSNPSADLAVIQADPTIHLMGLALNGLSASPQMLLDFSNGFANLGFYGTAKGDSAFSLRVQVFAGAGGSGALLNDQTFVYGAGTGGVCSGMLSAPNAPTPCNNAPFFYASGYNGSALSVLVSTTDSDGFYISNLYVGGAQSIPEPSALSLCGVGVALLAIRGRRWRRSAR